jgi:hypothetical protein
MKIENAIFLCSLHYPMPLAEVSMGMVSEVY